LKAKKNRFDARISQVFQNWPFVDLLKGKNKQSGRQESGAKKQGDTNGRQAFTELIEIAWRVLIGKPQTTNGRQD
jgi:hypothetical protein